MNPYAIVILAALLLEVLLSLWADFLNLRALRPELPEAFSGKYDADTYRRSQEYTRARTRFGLWPALFDLALVLAFWRLGGFEWWDEIVRGLGFGPVVTGVVYIGALLLGRSLLSIPFKLYSTFVIEERFGFNRTDGKTFTSDLVKGTLLGALLGAPLLAAILAFFESAGALAWVWCWVATTAFLLFVQFIAPTWLMPLFNEFKPLEDDELKRALVGYGESVSFPLQDVFVIDGSRRSTKANAFFTGFGRNKRVALYDTLIESQSTPELVGVLAHEVGHYKRGHILKGLALSLVSTGLLFWLLSLFLSNQQLFDAFGVTRPSVYCGLVFFGLLYTPIDLVLSIGAQAFSRKNEFEADAFAAETTGRPADLASALVKLSAKNLSNLTPHPLHVFLHDSHPPVLRRLAALREMEAR